MEQKPRRCLDAKRTCPVCGEPQWQQYGGPNKLRVIYHAPPKPEFVDGSGKACRGSGMPIHLDPTGRTRKQVLGTTFRNVLDGQFHGKMRSVHMNTLLAAVFADGKQHTTDEVHLAIQKEHPKFSCYETLRWLRHFTAFLGEPRITQTGPNTWKRG